MNAKQLAERRIQLVTRAAVQRAALAHEVEPLRARLGRVDQGVAVLRSIGRHPFLLAGAVLVLVAWRPRGVARWLQRGWLVWQLGRRLRQN